MRVRIRRTAETADLGLPSYATPGASAVDLRAARGGHINHGEVLPAPTGIFIEVPLGYEAQIRARSGLALNAGVSLANGVGTIDSDYRGEVMVLLRNDGSNPFYYRRGDRIAQMVICPVVHAEFELSDDLEETERGTGGFGSTG